MKYILTNLSILIALVVGAVTSHAQDLPPNYRQFLASKGNQITTVSKINPSLDIFEINGKQQDGRKIKLSGKGNPEVSKLGGYYQLTTEDGKGASWWFANYSPIKMVKGNPTKAYEFEVTFKIPSDFSKVKSGPVRFLLGNSPSGYWYLYIQPTGMLEVGYKDKDGYHDINSVFKAAKVKTNTKHRIRFVWFNDGRFYFELDGYKKFSGVNTTNNGRMPNYGISNRINYEVPVYIYSVEIRVISKKATRAVAVEEPEAKNVKKETAATAKAMLGDKKEKRNGIRNGIGQAASLIGVWGRKNTTGKYSFVSFNKDGTFLAETKLEASGMSFPESGVWNVRGNAIQLISSDKIKGVSTTYIKYVVLKSTIILLSNESGQVSSIWNKQ